MNQDKTYAAVTKLSKAIPKQVNVAQTAPKPDSNIQLNSNMSFKILALTFQTHLMNIARLGTFGRTMCELLRLNNLLDVIYPDDAPSAEIFGVINGAQEVEARLNVKAIPD